MNTERVSDINKTGNNNVPFELKKSSSSNLVKLKRQSVVLLPKEDSFRNSTIRGSILVRNDSSVFTNNY